jgi:hypothetical protein
VKTQRIFLGNYNAARLLHLNDYVFDKAFVYGIVLLSKWIGKERFPQGVYGQWPPEFPDDLVSKGGALPIDLDANPGDDLLPAHIRQGSAAASSSTAQPPPQ